MAIDTENKRRSVMDYAGTGIMPVPDGTIDASDRACIGWLYSGIAFAASVAPIREIHGFADLLNWFQLR